MPKVPPRSKRYLQVRRHVWRINNRTEILVGRKWKPCKDLATARKYAETHGYDGIRIKPV